MNHLFDSNEFEKYEEYRKKYESLFNLENEIIKEKLSQGINGVEWLVMQIRVDKDTIPENNAKLDSLEQFSKLCGRMGFFLHDVVRDALTIEQEDFYQKYGLNWWIAVDESLSYLAMMKAGSYEEYLKLLDMIFKGNGAS